MPTAKNSSPDQAGIRTRLWTTLVQLHGSEKMEFSDPSGCSRLHMVLGRRGGWEPLILTASVIVKFWHEGRRGCFSWWFPQMPAVYRGPTGPVCGSHLSHWSFHGSLSSSLYNILMVLFCLEEFSGSIAWYITNFSARSLLSYIFLFVKP